MTEDMHGDDHLDLIDALVEGRSSDAAAARRLVETCPECREAHRARLAVRQAVETQPVVPLSETERRRLRAAIWSGLETTPRPKPTTPLWYRIAPVAAALVLIVGVGGVLLSRGGGAETAETTAAAATGRLDAYAPQAESDRDLSGADRADAGGATATTLAATENTTAMAGPPATAATTAAPRRVSAEELAQAALEFALGARASRLDTDLQRCLNQDVLAPKDPFADERIVVDDRLAWMVAFGSQGDVSDVVVYGVDDCAVYYRDR